MSLAVGLDVGNGKCVVAVSTDGVVDAVLNDESSRETPTVVHLANNHRAFGTSAASLATSKPTSTISQLKRIVGRRFDGNKFQLDRLRLSYETSRATDGGISVKVPSSGEFKPAEMLGMLLSHLKRAAERTTSRPMPDCVIGVPAYFTSQQKNAYWDAAVIAGWNPIGLLHEGVATALEYGNGRAGGNSVVVLVDVGHCDTQVTVVSFVGKKQMRVLKEAWDPDLGGRDFDEVIFQHFVAMFEEKYKKEKGIISSDAKASVRLRAACEKAKRVLTVNREASVSIDYLMEGVEGVEEAISREKFEDLSKDLVGRIRDVFHVALEGANLEVDQVDSVELVGSGSRVPAISRVLTGLFWRGLSRTLNGSECVARGCALLHEMLALSPWPSSTDESPPRVLSELGITNKVFTVVKKRAGDLDISMAKEENLMRQDLSYEEAKNERNALESYIYKVRKEVVESKTYTAESKDEILRKLEQEEAWLYKDGDDVSADDYRSQLDALKQYVSFILNKDSTKKRKFSPSHVPDRAIRAKIIDQKPESSVSSSMHMVESSQHSAQEVPSQGHNKEEGRPRWDKPMKDRKDKKNILKSVVSLVQRKPC